jgi:hypothetical protein
VGNEEYPVEGDCSEMNGSLLLCFVFHVVPMVLTDIVRENVLIWEAGCDNSPKLVVALSFWTATTDWGGVGPQSLLFMYMVSSSVNANFVLCILIFSKTSMFY